MTRGSTTPTDVQQYYLDLHSLPAPTTDEYASLVVQMKAYRQGQLPEHVGQAVKMRLLHTHLWDVTKVAARYARSSGKLDLLDLIQEGNIRLLTLLDHYPFDEPQRFGGQYVATCASWAMLNAIYAAHPLHIPYSDYRKLKATGQGDILAQLEPISLDAAATPDEPFSETLEEQVQPTPTYQEQKARLLHLLCALLPANECRVLRLRYGLEADGISYPYEDIAHTLELSVSAVKRYEHKALQHVRDLYSRYEHETGKTSVFLAYDAPLLHYLEQQVRERQAHKPRLTRQQVRAQLDAVCQQLAQQGRPININTLAQTGQVSNGAAHRYLLQRGLYQLSPSLCKRLSVAYAALKAQAQPITGQALAAAAHVEAVAACWFLQHFEQLGA